MGNRRMFVADIDRLCMCYKHKRKWKEGALFKKGRRPNNPYKAGACKECVINSQKENP